MNYELQFLKAELRMKRYFIVPILGFFFLLSTFSFAQKDKTSSGTLTTAVVEDPIFYIHKVEPKQTLFSIAKKYDVEVTEIVLANPEAEKQIIPGQLLRIPIEKAKPQKQALINPDSVDYSNYMIHQVIKGQTLYSLSKEYGLSMEEIIAVNPALKEGLKFGQIILIPRKGIKSKKEESKNTIAIEPKQEVKEEKSLASSYKIGFMIPFYLNENDAIEEKQVFGEEESMYVASEVGIKFYQGALLAIDSLKKLGMNIQLYVYDVYDSASAQKAIQKPEFKNLHLILGPFFPSHTVMVADSAKKFNIPVATPFTNSDLILTKENVIKSVPSKHTEIMYLANYIDTAFANQNCVIIHNNKPEEIKLIHEYKQSLQDTLHLKILNYNASKSGIDYVLAEDKKNVVIVFSTQEDFVTNVVTKLNSRRNAYAIQLLSLSTWEKLKNLEVQYLQNLNYHYTSSYFVDYEDENTLDFINSFKENFKTEPDKYAFVGFDLSYYLLKLLKTNGKNFNQHLSDGAYQALHTSYLFSRSSSAAAFENMYYSIIKFEDYRLLKVN